MQIETVTTLTVDRVGILAVQIETVMTLTVGTVTVAVTGGSVGGEIVTGGSAGGVTVTVTVELLQMSTIEAKEYVRGKDEVELSRVGGGPRMLGYESRATKAEIR